MSNEIDNMMAAGQELNEAAMRFSITQMDYDPRPPHETGTALGLQRAAIRYARAVDAVLKRKPSLSLLERCKLNAEKCIPKAIVDHFIPDKHD